MGGGRWDSGTWASYTSSAGYDTKTVDDILSKNLHADLDPKNIKVRESRDSADNPNSTPIIVALDVTGSMGRVINTLAKEGMNTLCSEIYNRRPVSDPHIMFMGVGDLNFDQAPLQVSQFEADIRIATELEKLYLEQGGGSNDSESYHLPWYFAALHTSIDSFEKRGKKGYLFTIGDEEPPPELLASQVEKVLGYKPQSSMSTQEVLDMVSRTYEVFHIIIEEGYYFRRQPDRVKSKWTKLLGQRAILLSDYTKLAEVVVSILQVSEGEDAHKVASSWDGTTAVAVTNAVNGLVANKKASSSPGIVRL